MALIVPTALVSVAVAQTAGRLLDIVKKDKNEEGVLLLELNLLGRNVRAIEEFQDAILLDRSAISNWYTDLKDLMYDALDLLDSYAISVESKSFDTRTDYAKKKLFTFSCHMFNMDNKLSLVYKIKRINEKMGQLIKEGRKCKHGETLGERRKMGQETCPVSDPDHPMRGMNNDKKDVMRKLVGGGDAGVSGNEWLRAVGIVGLGGMGKTTLARFAYEEANKLGVFESSCWVWVSSEFDEKRLFKEILETFDHQKSGSVRGDRVAAAVKEKKFLLVLDDAWSTKKEDWDKLLVPLKHGKKGSRLIVTTRDKNVLDIIKKSNGGRMEPEIELTGLSEEILLDIVKEHAFPGKKLEEIGKKIVTKARGSPLAAKAIGGLLRQDISERHWKKIEESDRWDTLQEDDDGKNELTAASRNLQTRSEPCFTYCLLFPKGESIHADELIHQWLAHDYLGEGKEGIEYMGASVEESIEDMGASVLNYLKSTSVFEVTTEYNEDRIRMHDLVHDTSHAWGILNDHLLIEMQSFELPEERLRHLHIITENESSLHGYLEKIKRCERLRTLMLRNKWEYYSALEASSLGECFQQLKRLRVLVLRKYYMTVLPENIGELKHLAYLDLSYSWIDGSPSILTKLNNLRVLILRGSYLFVGIFDVAEHFDSRIERTSSSLEFLGQLSKLRYLDLSDIRNLEKLPESIKLLSNLRTLLLARCYGLQGLPDGICSLTCLERLDLYDCSKCELPEDLGSLSRLRELNLKNCHGGNIRASAGLRRLFTCRNLEKLSCQILRMTELRRLYADDQFMRTISGIGSLSSLETLDKFTVGVAKGHKIEELESLNQLRSLRIDELQNVPESEAEHAGLKHKSRLIELYLKWSPDKMGTSAAMSKMEGSDKNVLEVIERDQVVLEGLKPHTRLQKLTVKRYGGRRPPSWLRGQHLCFLKELRLKTCPFMCVIASGPETFPCVETLELRDLPELRGLFCPFPRLRSLHISSCGKLTYLPDLPSSLESIYLWDVGLTQLPGLQCQGDKASSLSLVDIRECPLLASLNIGFLESRLPYLRSLTIGNCEDLQFPPTSGFGDFESLVELTIENCPKLRKLSTEPGIAALPRGLCMLCIEDCECIELPELQCQGDEVSSLSSVDIRDCFSLTSLNIGFLESRLPYLQRLTIDRCENLQFPPTNGFKDFESLESLTIRNCPKLLSLSTEPGIAALPRVLRKLWIEDCECIEENSLEASLHPQLLTSLQEVIIRLDGLDITISKVTRGRWLRPSSERKEGCSRVKLVICILQSLEPGRIEKVDIHETADGIYCNAMFCETADGIYCNAMLNPVFDESMKYPVCETADGITRLQYVCSGLGTLAEGCLAQTIPLAKSLKYVVKSLKLERCPMLQQIDSALPPLQELVIDDCQSLDINSIPVSLEALLLSLRRLVLRNFCSRLSNIFLKWIMAHFLGTLDYCDIQSSDQDFHFEWDKIECRASIEWDDPYYYYEDNDCTRNEVLEEMLGKIPPSHVGHLSVRGIPEVTGTHLEQLFPNLTSLSSLKIENCQFLRYLPPEMRRLSYLENVEIVACRNFEGWEHVETGEMIPEPNAVGRLKLRNNNRFHSLPYYSHVQELDIECCNGIQDLSNLNKQMPLLRKLLISDCANLKYPPNQGFMQLINLHILILKRCPVLLNLSHDENCYDVISGLSELVINNCKHV